MNDNNKLTIEKFTTSGEAMGMASQLRINPAIYRDVEVNQIIDDFNKALEAAEMPIRIEPAIGKVYYLRFENERLDRALYILSSLVDYEKN